MSLVLAHPAKSLWKLDIKELVAPVWLENITRWRVRAGDLTVDWLDA